MTEDRKRDTQGRFFTIRQKDVDGKCFRRSQELQGGKERSKIQDRDEAYKSKVMFSAPRLIYFFSKTRQAVKWFNIKVENLICRGYCPWSLFFCVKSVSPSKETACGDCLLSHATKKYLNCQIKYPVVSK